MPGLDVSKVPFDLIINILNIIIMFVIVRFLVYKPVRKFMDSRTAKLNEQSRIAKEQLTEAQELKESYNEMIRLQEEQSEELLRKAKEDAEKQAAEITDAARKKADKMIKDAQDRIAAREEESVLSMQDKIIDLSLNIAEKILDEKIDDDKNRKLAEKFFNSELNVN